MLLENHASQHDLAGGHVRCTRFRVVETIKCLKVRPHKRGRNNLKKKPLVTECANSYVEFLTPNRNKFAEKAFRS